MITGPSECDVTLTLGQSPASSDCPAGLSQHIHVNALLPFRSKLVENPYSYHLKLWAQENLSINHYEREIKYCD